MRRIRKRSGKEILIDLTSLLDVMFIVLLVVLCGQNGITENLRDAQTAAENAKNEAEAEYRLYKDQRETADSINRFVWVASVEVPYSKNEITQRTILIFNEGEELKSFPLTGNDVEASAKAFRETLVDFIQKYKDKPVILSLNEKDDAILYRDETMVNRIFLELSEEYDNVFIKSNISEDVK